MEDYIIFCLPCLPAILMLWHIAEEHAKKPQLKYKESKFSEIISWLMSEGIF